MINEKLYELYQENWKQYYNELLSIKNDDEFKVKPTNPLHISILDEEKYLKSDLKVMVFGRETNDWEGDLTIDIKSMQVKYKNFFNGTKYKHRGTFTNAFNKLIGDFKNEFPEKKIEFIWNNIIKTGKKRKGKTGDSGKGKPPKKIYELEHKYFNVIEKEISILKPDIVIFFTGHSYDKFIESTIEGVKFNPVDGFTKKQLAVVENIDGVSLAFRTYHPRYLYIAGIEEYFSKIFELIKDKQQN